MYVCSSFKRKENIIGRHRRFGKLHAKWMQSCKLTEGPIMHGLLLLHSLLVFCWSVLGCPVPSLARRQSVKSCFAVVKKGRLPNDTFG